MNVSRIASVFLREWWHLTRDRRSLAILFFLPLFALLITAYSIIHTVKPLPLAVLDPDGTALSRAFLQLMTDSSYFQPKLAKSEAEARQWTGKGRVKGELRLPVDFSRRLLEGGEVPVKLTLNIADPFSIRVYSAYFNFLLNQYSLNLAQEKGVASPVPTAPPSHGPSFITLFNPSYDHFAFVVPPLLGCLMMSLLPILAAISLAREREKKSFDRVLASPTSPLEFLVGKFLPYFFIGLFYFLLMAAISVFWFKVPFRGSFLNFILLGILFSFWAVIFGLLIATLTDRQMTALATALVLTLLPSFIFSGIFFPVESSPWWVRAVALLVPTQYFTPISRGIFLKGTSWSSWWQPFLGLSLLAIATFAVTLARFRKIVRGP